MAKLKNSKRKSKRPDGKQMPKTRQKQQQEVNVYMYRRLDELGKVLQHMVQKVEMVSQLSMQMITTMTILNEKGLVSNDEIAAKQRELMLPIEERIAGIKDKVEGGVGGDGGGAEETGGGDAEKTVDANTTDSDGDTDPRVSESGEVQPENTGTAESDGGLQRSKLSDETGGGSDTVSENRESPDKSDVATSISEPADSGHKAPPLKLD